MRRTFCAAILRVKLQTKERRSIFGWIHFIWLRFGLFMLVAMPAAAFFMFRAQGFDDAILKSDSELVIDVTSDDAITFVPREPRGGVLLIPGCPPDPFAYAPFARTLAREQLAVAIVRVPFRCAPLPSHEVELAARVSRVMQAIKASSWVLAGHSRGAAHALRIALNNPQRFRALVIMGSTHPRERDYSQLPIQVTKIIASEDGVAPLDASQANRHLLPASAEWVVIEGGNHSQFAHYGFQLFDGRARISREVQQAQAIAAISRLF